MEWMISGVPATRLAERFGTPLYVYDQTVLEQKMQAFKSAFSSPDFHCHVAYASKAFCCLAMMQLVRQEGLWADVVSGGELYTALKAGMDPAHLIFHGNNKTPAELDLAMDCGIGTLVVDHEDEMNALLARKDQWEKKPHILIRVNPGIEAHTHQYILTATPDSKFGIPLEQMDIIIRIARTLQAAGFPFAGFHSHIGSQIFEKEAFRQQVNAVARFCRTFEDACGLSARTLDFGGGFACRYTDADKPVPIPEVCTAILEAMKQAKETYKLGVDTLVIEPGRSIAAEAGTMLYTVGAVKTTPAKTFVFVDGGMADNIRPALYQAAYDALAVKDPGHEKSWTVTLAGKCCESGDILIEDLPIAPVAPGDVVAVFSVGAYGRSMASHYNKLPVPPVVFVRDGDARYVIQPETWADLVPRRSRCESAGFEIPWLRQRLHPGASGGCGRAGSAGLCPVGL